MKKVFSLVIAMAVFLTMAGCIHDEPENLKLPFDLKDVQNIVIYRKTDEPNSNERLGVEDEANVKLIYDHLEGTPIQKTEYEVVSGNPTYEFIFRLSDHTKFVITYYSEGVKRGYIYVSGENTYFTSSDIGWIWSNIEKPADTGK